MRFTILVLGMMLLFGCNSNENNKDEHTSDYKQAKKALKELDEALKKEDGTLWNHSLEGPLMFVNRKTRTIIANEGDENGQLVKKDDLYIGTLPENINIANTSVEWSGKSWTMVALPLPETRYERMNLLIHESFHNIQPALGFDSLFEKQSIHLDTKEGRIFLKLELEALKTALDSKDPNPHIQNALLFRMYRYQQFAEAKYAENSLEINEGLAEYTGSILSQRNDASLKKHYISHIDRFYTMPTFVRSFAYFTIPVYGYFMQKSDKDWNLEINKSTNLFEFISNFYKLENRVLAESEIMELGKTYHIESIIQFETQREIEIVKLKDKYRETFLGDRIVELKLKKMRIGFNPSNIMPLDSFGTVYPNLRVSDIWGVLEVDSCGALLSSNWDKVTISYPETLTDTLVSGRGWNLKLNKPWQLVAAGKKYILTEK